MSWNLTTGQFRARRAAARKSSVSDKLVTAAIVALAVWLTSPKEKPAQFQCPPAIDTGVANNGSETGSENTRGESESRR